MDVRQLDLPFDPDLFDDRDFRQGFSASQTRSFLPSQLRALRELEGLTQQALAERLGTRQSAISRLERVDNGSLNISTAIAIGRVIDRPFFAYWGRYSDVLAQVAQCESHPYAALTAPSFKDDPGFFPEKPPLPSAENQVIRAIQERLFTILDTPASDREKLKRMLRGYDLPPVSDTAPPYYWIVQAVQSWALVGRARQNFFTVLADCIGDFTALLGVAGSDPEAPWIEPLFYLCSQLPDAALAEPLMDLLAAARTLGNGSVTPLSLEVKAAFTNALLANVRDERLAPVLQEYLHNPNSHPALYATPDEIQAALRTLKPDQAPHPVHEVAKLIYAVQLEFGVTVTSKSAYLEKVGLTLTQTGWATVDSQRAIDLLYQGVAINQWQLVTARWTLDVMQIDDIASKDDLRNVALSGPRLGIVKAVLQN